MSILFEDIYFYSKNLKIMLVSCRSFEALHCNTDVSNPLPLFSKSYLEFVWLATRAMNGQSACSVVLSFHDETWILSWDHKCILNFAQVTKNTQYCIKIVAKLLSYLICRPSVVRKCNFLGCFKFQDRHQKFLLMIPFSNEP